MLHNPTVLRAHVAAGFWLKPDAPESMPMIAAQLLADGYDSPGARRPAQHLQRIGEALVEAGAWVPGGASADAWLGDGCGMRSTCRKGKRSGC
jgi:hypothetical protein